MLRLQNDNNKNKKQEIGKLAFSQFRLFKAVNTTTYAMSAATKLKDIGVARVMFAVNENIALQNNVHAELKQLGNKIKTIPENQRESVIANALDRISHQYKADFHFFYPVMDPAEASQLHLNETELSLNKLKTRKLRAMDDIENRYRKASSKARKQKIANDKTKMLVKYEQDIAIYEKEISNRREMQHLLNQIAMPISLKQFMIEINKLSTSEKQKIESLLTNKERLSSWRELVTEPYELMFVYDAKYDDFMVGIRSRYDHDHPHPTVIGGEEPEVLVAGTIDIKLDGETLKITNVRIDSGHFKPHAESFELIMRYIFAEMNPAYYDQVMLQTIKDDRAPSIVFRNRRFG